MQGDTLRRQGEVEQIDPQRRGAAFRAGALVGAARFGAAIPAGVPVPGPVPGNVTGAPSPVGTGAGAAT